MYMKLTKKPHVLAKLSTFVKGKWLDYLPHVQYIFFEENAKLSLLIQRHSFVRCCEIAWRRKGQSMKKVQQMQPLAVFYKCYLE